MMNRVGRFLARFQTNDTDDDNDDDGGHGDDAMLRAHCVLSPMLFAVGRILFSDSTWFLLLLFIAREATEPTTATPSAPGQSHSEVKLLIPFPWNFGSLGGSGKPDCFAVFTLKNLNLPFLGIFIYSGLSRNKNVYNHREHYVSQVFIVCSYFSFFLDNPVISFLLYQCCLILKPFGWPESKRHR